MSRALTRARAGVAVGFGALFLVLPVAHASGARAPGGVKIYDDPGCSGNGNAATVFAPFSIGSTGLSPNAHGAFMYVTDKDAHPEVVYGPIRLRHVDAHGSACLDIRLAPAGRWKVQVVEPRHDYAKSKVFTVEARPPPTTTTTRPTTTVPGTTTTASGSTTSSPSPAGGSTTTQLTATTTGTPTERPGSDLPWVIVQGGTATTTTPVTDALPRTGSASDTGAVAGAMLVGIGALLLALRHRRSRQIV